MSAQKIPSACPAVIIIRYGLAAHQRCKNALSRWFSVHANYSGMVSGLSCEVTRLEGQWPQDKGVAMLYFNTYEEAERWTFSVPEIKQQDWLDGVDMCIVPLSERPNPTSGVVQILDLQFDDIAKYECEYSDRAKDVIGKHCGQQIVGTNNVQKVKGLWQPAYLVVNAWSSMESFHSASCGEENRQIKETRQAYSNADACVFELEPLFNRC